MLILQGRIQGYMYNIKSEQDYQERIIPPSPERPSSPPVRSSLLSRWGPTPHSLIDSFATSTSTATQGTLARTTLKCARFGILHTGHESKISKLGAGGDIAHGFHQLSGSPSTVACSGSTITSLLTLTEHVTPHGTNSPSRKPSAMMLYSHLQI